MKCPITHNPFLNSSRFRTITLLLNSTSKFALMGDSIMQGNLPSNRQIMETVKKGGQSVPNYALGGDTTHDFSHHRWPLYRTKFPKLQHVWIHIGLNDLRHDIGVKCVFNSILQIHQTLLKDNVNSTFMSILLADVPDKSRRLNNMLKHSEISFRHWHLPTNMYAEDHIHPNTNGYTHLRNELNRLIQ